MATAKKPEVATVTLENHHLLLDDDDLPPEQPRGRSGKVSAERIAVDEYIAQGCRGLVVLTDLAPGTDEESKKVVAAVRARLDKAAKDLGYKLIMRFENRPSHKDKPQYNHYVWKLEKRPTQSTSESNPAA